MKEFLFVLAGIITFYIPIRIWHYLRYKYCKFYKNRDICYDWACKYADYCYYCDVNWKEKMNDDFVFYLPEQEREYRKYKRKIYCKKLGEGQTLRALEKLEKNKEI